MILTETAFQKTQKEQIEDSIYQAALTYVQANIGANFEIVPAPFIEQTNCWRFAIHRQFLDLDEPILAGHIKVDATSGAVLPLTADEIWDIQGRAETRAEHKRGKNPAKDDNGLILPYQAKIKVNAYMGGYVAFYAGSDGQPTFISGDPPIWRVETVLRLHQYGKVAKLGSLDVNAITAEVIPLSDSEIQHRQKRAEDAAITAKYAAAPRI